MKPLARRQGNRLQVAFLFQRFFHLFYLLNFLLALFRIGAHQYRKLRSTSKNKTPGALMEDVKDSRGLPEQGTENISSRSAGRPRRKNSVTVISSLANEPGLNAQSHAELGPATRVGLSNGQWSNRWSLNHPGILAATFCPIWR